MKTIQQWLSELPEPFRTHALKNAWPSKLSRECDTIYNALDISCWWNETPEGKAFWNDVDEHYRSGRKMPDPHSSWKQTQLNGIDL